MKLCITENGTKNIHSISKNEVLVGRSANADIQLQSENISRKHLIIIQEKSEFKALLLTENNWAICMGEEMTVNESIPFFEFGEIELPGDIKIKLILDAQEAVTSTAIKKIEFDLDSSKKKKSKTRKVKMNKPTKYQKKEQSKIISILIFAVVILAIAWYFEVF